MKKIKIYATGLFLILAGLLSSCIENNVPYPIIKLDITALEVEGETTGAVISTENRTVTVTLADTVPIAYHLTSLTRVLLKAPFHLNK